MTISAATSRPTGRSAVPTSRVPPSSTMMVVTFNRVLTSVRNDNVPLTSTHSTATSDRASYTMEWPSPMATLSFASGTRPGDQVPGLGPGPPCLGGGGGPGEKRGIPRGQPPPPGGGGVRTLPRHDLDGRDGKNRCLQSTPPDRYASA